MADDAGSVGSNMADDAGSCASESSIDSCPRECDISSCAVAGMGSFAHNVNIGMLGFPGAITSGKSAITQSLKLPVLDSDFLRIELCDSAGEGMVRSDSLKAD
eukprot:CAMPEP_0179478908 /NCGR_PEP_ID=MMETSP0799-20121207/57241_1 /TAXON_ID=46947 /ORGANISM="Geminigera cryophila, Strain CCMP2564" /LENGTH=102 /DNA_ID=CAMNT_0021290195 /DNA_START=463 /DNA_END=768 /DNA_ORIENTATION=+